MKIKKTSGSQRKTKGLTLRADGRPLLGGLALVYLGDEYYSSNEPVVSINRTSPIFANSPLVSMVDPSSVDRFSREAWYLINSSSHTADTTLYVTAGSSPHLLSVADFGLMYASNELSIGQPPQGRSDSGETVQPVQPEFTEESESAFKEGSSSSDGGVPQENKDESECASPDAVGEERAQEQQENCEPEVADQCATAPEDDLKQACDPGAETSDITAGAGAGAGGLVLALAGGGGAAAAAAAAAAVSVAVSGAVIDGYVEGAFVFADINGNGIFDSGEPSASTDELGAYEFTSTVAMDGVSIISVGGVDVDTGATVDFLVAPSGMTYVTPLSSVVYYGQEAGSDAASIMMGLGFSYDDLFIDPVAAYASGEDDGSLLVAGASLLTAVAAGAALVSGATGETAAEAAQSVFAQLGQQDADSLQAFIPDGTSTTDSATVLTNVLTSTIAAKVSDGLLAANDIDTSTIASTASSIGNVVEQLRSAKGSDGSIDVSAAQVFANIGQAVLKVDLEGIGAAIKNGEDVSGLISGIQETYSDSTRLEALKTAQQSAMEARKLAVDGLTLEKDIFSLTIDPGDNSDLDNLGAGGGDITGFKRPTDDDRILTSGDITSISIPLTELLANDTFERQGVNKETGEGLTFSIYAISSTLDDNPGVLEGGIEFGFIGGNLTASEFLSNSLTSGFTAADDLELVPVDFDVDADTESLPVLINNADNLLAIEVGRDLNGQSLYKLLHRDAEGAVLTRDDFDAGPVDIQSAFVEIASGQFQSLTDWFASNAASGFAIVEDGGLKEDASTVDLENIFVNETGDYAIKVGVDVQQNPIFERVYAGNMGEPLTSEEVALGEVLMSDIFVMRTDPEVSPTLTLGVTSEFQPHLTSSYGDYHFAYKARVDSTGEVATGHFTLQVSPEAEFTVTEGSLQEAVKQNYSSIGLSELIAFDTFGSGDRLSIDNLPAGSNITGFFDADNDGHGDIDDLLIQQVGDFPLVIPSTYLLGTRFPELQLNIPGNESGTIPVKFTLSSRYGSASSSTTKTVNLEIEPSVDGLKNISALNTDLLAQVGTGRVFAEDLESSLFAEGAAFDYLTLALDPESQLALYDTDGSEGLAIAIGLPDGWAFSGEVSSADNEGLNEKNDVVSWYVFTDEPSGSLVEQLESLTLVPPANFYGAFDVIATTGAFERADLSTLTFQNPTFALLSDTVAAKPELLILKDSLANFTNEATIADGDSSYTLFEDNITLIAKEFFDFEAMPGVQDSSAEELLQIKVEIPNLFFVLPNADESKASWVAIGPGEAEATTIYQVNDVQLSELYNHGVADLVLKPISGQSSDPDIGSQIKVSGKTYIDRSALSEAIDFATQSGIVSVESTTKIAPSLEPSGDISTVSPVMVLSEAQDSLLDWKPLQDFIQVNSLTNDGLSSTLLKIVLELDPDSDDSPALQFGQLEGQTVEPWPLTSDAESESYVYEIPVTVTSMESLVVRGAPYSHNLGFSAEISVITTQTWGAQTVTAESVSTQIVGRIDAVATDLAEDLVVKSPVVGSEDVEINLTEFVATAGGLGDTDGSETLYYEIRLPSTVTLVDVNRANVSGRLDSVTGQKVFEVGASNVGNYWVKGSANYSDANLQFSILAIAEDVNGSRTFATDADGSPLPSVGVLNIDPVSDAPGVSSPSSLTKLLVDESSSISVPIVVTKRDFSESLDVTITVESNAGIDGLSFETSSGPLELTGNQLIIPADKISELSTLKVFSSVDYRDDNAVTLTIDAGSTDGVAERAQFLDEDSQLLPTIELEVYKPVGVPGLSVTKQPPSGDQDSFPELVIDVTMPNTPSGLGPESVALLVIGVPGDTYFLSGGVPVGANLGDGIWLLTQTDSVPLFSDVDSNLQAVLEVRGTDGSTFQVKALVTDATGGTSSSSETDGDESVVIDNPLTDPVVAVFGSSLEPTIVNQTVEFDFSIPVPAIPGTNLSDAVISTEPRSEYLYSWMVGDASNLDGTAYFVNGDVADPTIEDLFEDLESLAAAVDADSDNVLTFEELTNAEIHFWFDSLLNGSLGQVDLGELVSIDSTFDSFEIDLTTVSDENPTAIFSGQGTSDEGTQIERFSSGSLTYSPTGGETMVAAFYETGIPYTSFAADNKPAASAESLSSDGLEGFREDESVNITISFTPMNTDMLPNPTIVNLVKVYGVPSNAVLTGAVFVEAEDETSEEFWIVTMPAADEISGQVENVGLELKYTQENVVGTINLEIEPLVSVTDVDGSVYETVFGSRQALDQISFTPVAEEDLVIERVNDVELSMDEGGSLTLTDIGVSVSSPDVNETLTIQLQIKEADGDLLNPAEYLTGTYNPIDQTTVSVSQDDLKELMIQLPNFYNKDLELLLAPVSTHTDGSNTDSYVDLDNVLSVPVTVRPVADGLSTLSIELVDNNDTQTANIDEGESFSVDISASAVDPSESLNFVVEVGGSIEAIDAVQSFGGKKVSDKTEDGNFWLFELDEDDISAPLEVFLDPYFDGNVQVKVNGYSIEPTTGELSDVNADLSREASLSVAPVPGNSEEAPSYKVTVLNSDGLPFESLALREGETESISIRVTAFDGDETFVLVDALGNSIADPTPETLSNGSVVYNFPLSIDSPDLTLAVSGITGLQLKIEESEEVHFETLPSIDVTVEQTASEPLFDSSISEIRVELAEGGEILAVQTNSEMYVDLSSSGLLSDAVILPMMIDDGSDDVLHFELSGRGVTESEIVDIPEEVELSRGSIIARGGLYQENKAYHLTSAQLVSGFTITALTGLFGQTAEAQMLLWEAIHTEATTGEQARSSSIAINLTKQVGLEGQRVDTLTDDWLVLDGSKYTLRLTDGVAEDQFDISVSGSNTVLNVIGEVDSLEGREIALSFGSDSLTEPMMTATSVAVGYETEALGGASGEFGFNATVLPSIGLEGFDFGAAFGDGYLAEVIDSSTWTNNDDSYKEQPWFAQVNVEDDDFSFIDPTTEFVVIDPGLIGVYEDDSDTLDIDESLIIGFGNLAGEFTVRDLDGSGDISMARIHGTEANDLIMAGVDTASVLFGAGGTNEIYGSSEGDLIVAGHEADFIHSQGGNDVVQIATDASYNEANAGDMEGLLDAILGESSTDIMSLVNSKHASAFSGDGIDVNSLSFKGIVTDYSREANNADRLVFTNGAEDNELTIEAYNLGTFSTWGNESSYIYTIAKSVDSLTVDGATSTSESYFSMILMSDYAANSSEDLMVDLEAAGIIAT